MSSRIAAAVLATGLVAHPALALEYATYQHLEVPPGALQPCRNGMLLTLPEGWQAGDGAVVLLTMEKAADAVRDTLVSTLLYEHAAVLELASVRCDAAPAAVDAAVGGAIDALAAMKRTMGSGMVVAIGYGPGSTAMLDVVRASPLGPPGAQAEHYAAAVALGDGAPAFVLGQSLPASEDAPLRLAALCRALAGVAGGMGAQPEGAMPASAADACLATLGGGTASAVRAVRGTEPR